MALIADRLVLHCVWCVHRQTFYTESRTPYRDRL